MKSSESLNESFVDGLEKAELLDLRDRVRTAVRALNSPEMFHIMMDYLTYESSVCHYMEMTDYLNNLSSLGDECSVRLKKLRSSKDAG